MPKGVLCVNSIIRESPFRKPARYYPIDSELGEPKCPVQTTPVLLRGEGYLRDTTCVLPIAWTIENPPSTGFGKQREGATVFEVKGKDSEVTSKEYGVLGQR
jgi:hypothetical protein